jgi:hypothetical protein
VTLSVFHGLRGSTVLPRKGEDSSTVRLTRDPSRGAWVRTRLDLQEVRVRQTVTDRYDFSVLLECEERPIGESGEEPESGYPQVVLQLPVQGKEVSLLTGLVGRTLNLTGKVPADSLSFAQLKQAYQVLVEQYNELNFQLEEVRRNALEHTRRTDRIPLVFQPR